VSSCDQAQAGIAGGSGGAVNADVGRGGIPASRLPLLKTYNLSNHRHIQQTNRAAYANVSQRPAQSTLKLMSKLFFMYFRQFVPRYKLSGLGRRAFRVAGGPKVWNSIADCLRDPALELASFKRQLKTFLFARY